jgi:hypothetical protein
MTLLWISFVTWLTGPIDGYYRLSDPVKFSAENVELQFPGDIEPGEIKAAIAKWIQEQRDTKAKNFFDQFDDPPEKIADRIVGKYHPRTGTDVFRDWASPALLPPLVLFVLGSLMLWALRGFRT